MMLRRDRKRQPAPTTYAEFLLREIEETEFLLRLYDSGQAIGEDQEDLAWMLHDWFKLGTESKLGGFLPVAIPDTIRSRMAR